MIFLFVLDGNFRKKYTSMTAFAEELGVGRTRFYKWLRDAGIWDDRNDPNEKYDKYFMENDTYYARRAEKPSWLISDDGKKLIRDLLTDEDIKSMPRSKDAKPRHRDDYKHYR